MKTPLKLSKSTYLLILLIEECAEIIHRTCKAIRFGMEEKQQGKLDTNRARLDAEIVDFESIKKLLKDGYIITPQTDYSTEKLLKVEKYMKYSAEECGTLDLSN
jgi:hypothetical protein